MCSRKPNRCFTDANAIRASKSLMCEPLPLIPLRGQLVHLSPKRRFGWLARNSCSVDGCADRRPTVFTEAEQISCTSEQTMARTSLGRTE